MTDRPPVPRTSFIASFRFALALLALLLPILARADDAPPEPIRVRVDAPSDCVDASSFFDAVRARTPRVRRADANEGARTLVVRVVVGATAAKGTLVVDGAERTVVGAGCGEVVAALSFVAALSIDPNASPPAAVSSASVTNATSVSVESAASTVASAPSPIASSSPSTATPAVSARTVLRVLPPPPELEAVAHDARATRSTLRASAGFGVQVADLGAPDLVVLPQVHVELEDDVAGVVHFDLRLRGARGSGGRVPNDVGAARFRWTTAALEGCPLHFRIVSSFFFRPCVAVDAGVVDASGEAVATPRSSARAWVAAQLVGRFDLVALDALRLELDAALAAPLARDTFVFDPATEIYRPPAVYPFFALALGVRFP